MTRVTVKKYGWRWEAVARRGRYWACAHALSRRRAIEEAVLRLDAMSGGPRREMGK